MVEAEKWLFRILAMLIVPIILWLFSTTQQSEITLAVVSAEMRGIQTNIELVRSDIKSYAQTLVTDSQHQNDIKELSEKIDRLDARYGQWLQNLREDIDALEKEKIK